MSNKKTSLMKRFISIFKDNNEYNEKTIVGFLAFIIMVVFASVDIVTGYLGKSLQVNEFIFNSFLYITLGCFGIAEVSKVFNKTNTSTETTNQEQAKEEEI